MWLNKWDLLGRAMKKNSKSKSSVPRVDPYLEGLMAKLLEHLVGLEKKMDAVIAQTAQKPNNAGTPSKPFQSPEVKQPRHERPLYEAICADCHKVCEVPFRPSEDRPVYCKQCFAKRKAGGNANKPFPVLTPVAMPSRTANKPAPPPAPVPAETPKKIKKSTPAKKTKKKK